MGTENTIETTIRHITMGNPPCPFEATIQRGDSKWIHRFSSAELAAAFVLGCRVALEAAGGKTIHTIENHR